MNHYDHMRLLRPAVTTKKQVWADLGSGDGAFTLALRELGGEATEIYSVDIDESRLALQKKHFDEMFPGSKVHFFHENFTQPLDIPMMDGIIMANSLHYIENKIPFLIDLKEYLKPTGKLLIVEYNSEAGNRWVPYPLSLQALGKLCQETGFLPPQKIGSQPSEFLKEIYSAVMQKK